MNILADKKQINELMFVDGIQYHEEHTWAKFEGDLVKIGITDFAQDKLGDIIFIELPQVGKIYRQGEEFGQVESAKVLSSLYMPLSGEVKVVNKEVEDSPETINTSPFNDGWMIIIEPKDLNELSSLLSKEQYINLIK